MSNKYIKLTSKRRERPKATYVVFEGVQMTAVEREALLRKRAAERRREEALKPAPKPTVTKGQIIEPPTSRPATNISKKKQPGLFQRLFGKKKKQADSRPTAVATSAAQPKEETPAVIVTRTEAIVVETSDVQDTSVIEETVVKVEENVCSEATEATACEAMTIDTQETDVPTEEIAAEQEAMAVEEAVETTDATSEPVAQEEVLVEEQTEDDTGAVEEVVQLYQKLKRVPKLELLRFARQTAAGADSAIIEHQEIAERLSATEAEIRTLKTPKDATEEQRKALNAQRAALRKERDGLKRKGLIAHEKAVSLERASDEYSAVASWLLEKEVNYRKQPRLNPVDSNLSENIIPLSERVAQSSVPGVSKERIEDLKESL